MKMIFRSFLKLSFFSSAHFLYTKTHASLISIRYDACRNSNSIMYAIAEFVIRIIQPGYTWIGDWTKDSILQKVKDIHKCVVDSLSSAHNNDNKRILEVTIINIVCLLTQMIRLAPRLLQVVSIIAK